MADWRLRAVARSIAFGVFAYVVFVLLGAVMMQIPSTPHGRMLRGFYVLNSYRNCTDCEDANAAFDEWLRLGRQVEIVEATVLPIAAGIAVILASRGAGSLSLPEVILITIVFAIGQAWRAGSIRIDLLPFLGVVIFGTMLLLHQVWATRSSRTRQMHDGVGR